MSQNQNKQGITKLAECIEEFGGFWIQKPDGNEVFHCLSDSEGDCDDFGGGSLEK